MWKRIEYAEWVDMVPIIAFILTFSVFVLLVTRTILMKKTQVKQLASLPLDLATPSPEGERQQSEEQGRHNRSPGHPDNTSTAP
jgi:hypothetical protein